MNSLEKKPKIGIHLRLQSSVSELAQQAYDIGAPYLQFFLTSSTKHNRYISISNDDRMAFRALRSSFSDIYIHNSYWINPATGKEKSAIISYHLLNKELSLARKLSISKLVLHPGAANGYDPSQPKEFIIQKGIENVARILNRIMKRFPDITILLENTTHGNYTVGSKFEDLIAIKNLLDFPDRIGFCLDFAHAFSYGYSLDNPEAFYELVDKTIGLHKIQLIHFNDTTEQLGSKKDAHALPGQGKIGEVKLLNLVNNPFIKEIPLLIEPPQLSHEELKLFIKNFQF